jgi:hypothetical protein
MDKMTGRTASATSVRQADGVHNEENDEQHGAHDAQNGARDDVRDEQNGFHYERNSVRNSTTSRRAPTTSKTRAPQHVGAVIRTAGGS